MVLSEGGAPLSAGQKQLAALARALLKRSKVRIKTESGQRSRSRRLQAAARCVGRLNIGRVCCKA
jgi:ABC-type lipoprotein export system ATPase subunit